MCQSFDWEDEDKQIVKITNLKSGKVASVFLVNLNKDTVETVIIDKEILAQTNIKMLEELMDFTNLKQNAKRWKKQQNPYPQNIRWYEDDKAFDTLQECYEWVSSGIYNEIGYFYDGYITSDVKSAYVLVYQLTKLNTIEETPKYKIFTYEEYISNKQLQYRVWIECFPD